MKDPYIILGISKEASFDELKSAYRKLCLKYHPDICKDENSTEKMAEINCAYEFLKDKLQKQDKKQSNTNNFKKENTSKKQKSNNNQNTSSKKANKRSFTKEEWNDFWNKYWEKRKAYQSAYSAHIGIKMKERLQKNLEPIRRENDNFYQQTKTVKTYNELLTLCQDHYDKISQMIEYMYLYTEKCHKYGLPTYYKYGHTTFNTKIKTDKNFPLTNVNSSHIKAIGYDVDNSVLYIKFSNDSLYVYFCVSPKLFTDFETTKSKGKFFEEHIRNEYDYRRII